MGIAIRKKYAIAIGMKFKKIKKMKNCKTK